MNEGKRPGGLTALAVINFVFSGWGLIGLLGLAAFFAFVGKIPTDEMDEAQKAQIYVKKGKSITRKRINIKKEKPLQKELSSFIQCVKERKEPLVSGQQGRDALKVAAEILQKIKAYPKHA